MYREFKSAVIASSILVLVACGQSAPPAPDLEATEAAPASDVVEAPAVVDVGLSELPSGKYVLDKTHAYITFSYSHLGFSNPHVGFNEFDVTLELDSQTPAVNELSVVINADSIASRVEKFDAHLKSDDMFFTEQYPTITFADASVDIEGAEFSATGDLTIKGITKSVTLEGKINKAANHPMRKVPWLGISATAKVNRSDWGLTVAVPAVSDEVTIYIEAELAPSE